MSEELSSFFSVRLLFILLNTLYQAVAIAVLRHPQEETVFVFS